VTNTSGFDIKGFLPASLDAKKYSKDHHSSCDEDSMDSQEICCIFDNNVEEQERSVVSILHKFDMMHDERINSIIKCQQTEEELKKQKEENERIRKEVDKLKSEN
jgi:hypothetical protein